MCPCMGFVMLVLGGTGEDWSGVEWVFPGCSAFWKSVFAVLSSPLDRYILSIQG